MYISAYAKEMRVTVTEFRKDLFRLVERVIAGETVEFVHRGAIIRLVVPESRSSRLDRLTPRQITSPQTTEEAECKLHREMLAEMEKDWSEI